MSTERHLPRKRPGITIDAEAQNQTNPEQANPEMAAQEGRQGAVEETVSAAATDVETAQNASAQENSAEIEQPLTDNQDAPVDQKPVDLKPAPAQKPAPKKGGMAGAFMSGLTGAVLALAGAYALQSNMLQPYGISALSMPTDNSLSERIAVLESNFTSRPTGRAEQIAALPAEVAGLKDKIAMLEQAAATPAAAANNAEITALASRIAALEGQTGGASPLEAVTTLRNGLSAEISGLKSDIAAVKTEMANRASEPGLAAAVAATALRAAVDRGGAFAAELENLAAVQPDAPAIAALRGFAAAGVPTRQDLSAEFESAAQAMMAAAQPVDPNASLYSRLLDSAKSLVKVRPVGALEGETPAARIARMGEALANGDDAGVASEFAALPAPSRDAGAAFMEHFNARAEADRLIAEAVKAASPKAGG
jgi:hypothetical protein